MKSQLVLLTAAIIAFAAIITACPAPANADKPLRVVSYHIPLLVDDAQNGAFVTALREAAKRAGVSYTLTLYPTKRAQFFFENGAADAIIPALKATILKGASLTTSFFTKKIHAFVRKGTPVPRSLDDLKGKRIGLVLGFAYPKQLYSGDYKLDFANNTSASLKKLVNMRVDAVIADGYTATYAMKKMNLGGIAYDLSAVLHAQPAFMAFQPTPEGRAMAKRFSRAFESMNADGTSQRILPKID